MNSMKFAHFLKNLFKFLKLEKTIAQPETVYSDTKVVEQVHSLWDYIRFTSHSQAYHICNVLGFEEWVSMDEILRRVKELFGAEYKNERSLYPYIKTLVDCGLLETTGFGGKKHWRKRDLIVRLEKTVPNKQSEPSPPQTAKSISDSPNVQRFK